MIKISLLGSTGSIGTSTLDIVAKFSDEYEIIGLAAGSNVELLAAQIRRFCPQLVCLAEEGAADKLRTLVGTGSATEIISGPAGVDLVATMPEADIVVAAISGSAGLLPTVAAVRAGKKVALANKESLVTAGQLIMEEAARTGAEIVPVDSEHSAIYQLLRGSDRSQVHNIILTASGGPFLHSSSEELKRVTPAQALKHPRWEMGSKVTIDSASLMNKGLEVIEAFWLFGYGSDRIKVIIHPQSIIHSMVEFIDGSVFAQLSEPDMKGPIGYALSCPQRLAGTVVPLDFARLGELSFCEPDLVRFPCLGLAYQALREGGLMPAVMNAANEIAVDRFISAEIPFMGIPVITDKIMMRFENKGEVALESILEVDRWARQEALTITF
ncbi:MAG: 1-deoxy-D-xylulose-5-phosphate reductoisomerase [Deltaproteobacteria bacterium]|nr:1-deoxy-D-xylulose-5-phosphate reductoisomerase [Deltaproteobacteria bacterium]